MKSVINKFSFAGAANNTEERYFQRTAPNNRPTAENVLGDEFAEILQQGNIKTVFQPIVSLSNGELPGYEALSRGPGHSFLKILKSFSTTPGQQDGFGNWNSFAVSKRWKKYRAWALPV